MNNKGFLFISNSTKPSQEVLESVEPIAPSSFSLAAISAADKMNWKLHLGINRNHPECIKGKGFNLKFYDQHTYRNIFALKDNWIAYKNLCHYLKENPDIEIIHCNTPIGGVVGRLAGKKYHKKVIYTAHGFHFFKGAPLFNRTILKWVEKWLAHYTDVLITINQEDFEAAKKLRLKKGGKIYKIAGVGIKLSDYEANKSRSVVRQSLSISDSDFVCICMGDVIKRKNYRTAIEAICKLKDTPIHYLICGIGSEMDNLKELCSRLKIDNRVHFLGYRSDMKDLLFASDCFLFSSLQEGLPRSTMEAMAAGLPCIVSDIRGNRDLIDPNKGGFLISPKDADGFAQSLNKIIKNPNLGKEMGKYNQCKITKFGIIEVEKSLYEIYNSLIQNN